MSRVECDIDRRVMQSRAVAYLSQRMKYDIDSYERDHGAVERNPEAVLLQIAGPVELVEVEEDPRHQDGES